jgi:peptidoglycan hydrolase-like protein with peptidoglycan-binding domain
MEWFGGKTGAASGETEKPSSAGATASAGAAASGTAAGRPWAGVAVVAVTIVAVAAAAGTYLLAHGTSGGQQASASVQKAALARPATGPAAPLRVISTSPGPAAGGVEGTSPVTVTFSAPLAVGSPMPSMKPAVQGSWQQAGKSLTFSPVVPFSPSSRITLQIPAGASGVRSVSGGLLARPLAVSFRTRAWSTGRLSELLAQLGYLPLTWNPSTGTGRRPIGAGAGADTAGAGRAAQIEAAYSPPAGTFRWHHGYPATLRSQWRAAGPSPVLKGAVMAFESQHGMTVNGVAGAVVWNALLRAAERDRGNPAGYTYAIASKGSPETLTIWHDGHIVLRTAANTGIPVAPTADGTFPVYLRYRFQIMRGVNPDGSSYADPVSYVSYFDGGDAVHYFPRGSYGFPQSLGCVELPLTAAARAWPYLTYGSLVTVAG